jgi:enoyl-CoA hydratase
MRTFVESQLESGVLTLLIQRAEKRNALSRPVLAELSDKLATWAPRQEVRVVVLTGEGDRAFASGGDVKELMAVRSVSEAQGFAEGTRAVLDRIRNFPVPVIAALNGDALGGGAELAMSCDVRLAAPHARIGYLQGKLGISTAWGGGSDLMRVIGAARALKLLCTAEILDAQRACELGLIDVIASSSEAFMVQATSLAGSVAGRPRQVLSAFKSLALAYRNGASVSELSQLETSHFVTTWVHQDHWDAVAAAFPNKSPSTERTHDEQS